MKNAIGRLLLGTLLCGLMQPFSSALAGDETSAVADGKTVAEMNRAGLKLLTVCAETDCGKPVMISPFSIDSAFSLLWLGSDEVVRQEIGRVLGMSEGVKTVSSVNRSLSGAETPCIKTSNSLWADKSFPLSEKYQKQVNGCFPTSVFSFDSCCPKETADAVNGFVSSRTEKTIDNVIGERDIVPGETMLMLINTLYFKGTWQTSFDKSLTVRDFPFDSLDGNVSKVEMMRNLRYQVGYGQGEDYQVISMPYKSDSKVKCSFVAVLPCRRLGVRQLLTRMCDDGDLLRELLRPTRRCKVRVSIPKLEFEYKRDMKDQLKSCGMVNAFSAGRHYCAMSVLAEDLSVDKVVHATRLKLDEEGTEAAAATVIGVGRGHVAEIPTFVADHPFLGFIVDDTTGLILFASVIRNIGRK